MEKNENGCNNLHFTASTSFSRSSLHEASSTTVGKVFSPRLSCFLRTFPAFMLELLGVKQTSPKLAAIKKSSRSLKFLVGAL